MVKRTRLRRFLVPLVLYCVSGGAGTYFVWHALNGNRGLKVSDEYEKTIAMLQKEQTAVKAERAQWEHRIALMRGAAIDRDLLEEEARLTLDRVSKNDLVIFLPNQR